MAPSPTFPPTIGVKKLDISVLSDSEIILKDTPQVISCFDQRVSYVAYDWSTDDSSYPGHDDDDQTGIEFTNGLTDSAETRLQNPVFIDQRTLAHERISNWPDCAFETHYNQLDSVYKQVKSCGIPNEVGARIPLHTRLNIDLWKSIATDHADDNIVLSGIQYGFSLQYTGGPLREIDIETHASGDRYKAHINDYLDTEIDYGAIVGPFVVPPIEPWVRTSPIMTRPKAESSKRRIIIDLSYPPGENVNMGVIKNNYYGSFLRHSLP